MSYNKVKSLTDNVTAIETALAIREQGRTATDTEKETLSRYSGFGGIKDVLNIGTDKPFADDMAEPLNHLQDVLRKHAKGDDSLYNMMIENIKSSVLTAFYTPSFLIETVANQIQDTFTANKLPMRTFLEPSAGTGGFLPIAMNGTHAYAFEKDHITGLLLSLLNEDATTLNAGFETLSDQYINHKTFDVIASNIPFGNFRVFDAELWKKGGIYEQSTKTIHNYFFVKAMELLNEGGLLVFVTSRGIADTPGNKFVREYLVNHANLITALRLPDALFMQTSGIEVGSDLLIFQKNTRKTTLSVRERMFLQVAKEKADNQGATTEHANKLFTMPKTTLSTNSRIATNQFGKYVRKYQWVGDENSMTQYLSAVLKFDFERYFRKNLLINPGQEADTGQMSLFDGIGGEVCSKADKGIRPYTGPLQGWMKDGAMVIFEGQVGTLQIRKSSHCSEVAVDFVPVDEGKVNMERANDYMPIRTAYFELSTKESDERKEYAGLRETLNRHYDAFVKKWGFFHDNDNKEFIMLDSLGTEVFTIEISVGSDISKPTSCVSLWRSRK